MIATGTRSLVPTIPSLAEASYLTNESVFDLTALPRTLLVIGGGPFGCELAQAFCQFGARTFSTHDEPLFLPKDEGDAAQMVSDALARDGVEIHLNRSVIGVRVEDGKKLVQTRSDGNLASIAIDEISIGIGRTPAVSGLDLETADVLYDLISGIRVDDFLRTTNPRIYSASDVCVQHQFTDVADAAARIVVRNAPFLGRQRVSARTIPQCTYTVRRSPMSACTSSKRVSVAFPLRHSPCRCMTSTGRLPIER